MNVKDFYKLPLSNLIRIAADPKNPLYSLEECQAAGEEIDRRLPRPGRPLNNITPQEYQCQVAARQQGRCGAVHLDELGTRVVCMWYASPDHGHDAPAPPQVPQERQQPQEPPKREKAACPRCDDTGVVTASELRVDNWVRILDGPCPDCRGPEALKAAYLDGYDAGAYEMRRRILEKMDNVVDNIRNEQDPK